MRRGSLFIGLILSLALGLLTSCRGGATATPADGTAVDPIENEPVSASGEVVPGQWLQAGFTIPGILEAILVDEGERISEGDELARLDDTSIQLEISQETAALRHAEAVLDDLKKQPKADELAAAEAAVANAEANFDRLERTKAKEIELDAAQAQIDSSKAALEVLQLGASESQIRSAEADVQAAQLSLEKARLKLRQSVLKAPFDGMIFEIYEHEGNAVSPGTPILLLADPNSLQIETTDLTELDVTRIQVGDPVTVTIDALPELALNGRVKEIANRAASGPIVTFKVTIELDQTPDSLRWGMTAFVTIGE